MTALPMPAAPRPHYLTFLATLAEQQPDKIALRVSAVAANPGSFAEHRYAQLASGRRGSAFGVRRRSVAPTPLWQERSDAAGSVDNVIEDPPRASGASQSAVALRFPPHSISPVSCGPPAKDTRITIHDRETGALLAAGQEGELQVHSPSVAAGYWNNPAATAAAFPQPGTLRTGDLGFLHDGELYVTGRVKDLIIIRGRNLYPNDIKTCVAALLPTATGANSIAAFEFSGNGSGSGALGVLIEAPRAWVASVRKQDGEITSYVRRIREALAETFEVTADLIAFVAPGDFPRTSSGNVQRGASRDGVINGTLPVIHRDQLSSPNADIPTTAPDRTAVPDAFSAPAAIPDAPSDRGAVNDGSRGFQPTVPNHEKAVSRSDTWTDGPVHGGNDDPPPGSNVAPRRAGLPDANRGLKSTATGMDRSAVGEDADVQDGELVEHLERGLLDFLRREKLGNMQAVPHDATFSSLGIDSLAAASLAVEIEKVFGVKIRDETLYDYPTLQRLAGYIEIRLATSDDSSACVMPDALPESSPFAQRMAKAMERVHQLRAANLYLFHPVTSAVEPGHATLNGERMITFAGYEYLDIGAHPDVKEAMVKAIEEFGTGAHGASIMGGKTAYHDELERELAALMKSEDALVYTSGFLTSFSTVAAFVGPGDVVIGDSFNHASIIDGCRMSGARFVSFTHGELEVLERALVENRSPHALVVVDGVFSMDGDIANIPEISRLCRKYGAYLMVDEAHSIGAIGETGRGVQEYFGLPSDAIDLKMGTLSKALGGVGGFIAGKAEVIDFLRHHSRGYMFAAALPAPNAAVSLAGLRVLENEPWRVRSLQEKAKRWRDGVKALGFDTFASKTPVVPIRMPDQSTAFEFAAQCWRKGVVAMPVVFPAVAENAPRVRTFVTLGLSNDAIDRALEVFALAGREVGLIA